MTLRYYEGWARVASARYTSSSSEHTTAHLFSSLSWTYMTNSSLQGKRMNNHSNFKLNRLAPNKHFKKTSQNIAQMSHLELARKREGRARRKQELARKKQELARRRQLEKGQSKGCSS